MAVDAEKAFVGTVALEGEERLDDAALTAWMQDNVAGFEGPIDVRKFAGGQSNPTYRVNAKSGSYVLRRKPMGVLLPSAHAVDREFQVISGLHPTGFRPADHPARRLAAAAIAPADRAAHGQRWLRS